MRGSSCVVIKTILLSTTLLTPAYAEEVKPDTSLDTVTVYATRKPQSTFNAPAMVNTIELDRAGNATSGTLNDILDHQVGVEVERGPRSTGQTVSIRGYSDEAIITLIDGRRQNFVTGHDGRQYIDSSLLKSIEIVRGSSSAIYGGGGIGGVIAFETKDAADLLEPGDNFGMTTSLLARSGNNTFSPTVSAYGRTDNLDLLGSVTYKRSGDVETGDGRELQTEERIVNLLAKAGYTFADYHTTNFAMTVFNNDGEEPNNPGSSSNTVVGKEVKDYQFSLKYTYDNPDNDVLNPKLHLYHNRTKTDEKDLTGTNAGRVRSRDFRTYGITADNQSRFSLSEGNEHILSYGIEYYTDTLEPSSTSGSFDGVPDAEAEAFGIYLQDEIDITTGAGTFTIIPAVRYDHFSSEDNSGNSQSEGAVSPKLSVSYKPNSNFMVYSSVARAFRAPSITESYATGQHFPFNNFIPNPDLKSETVTTVEFGAGVNFSDVLTDADRLQVKGAVYRSWGKDFIALQVLPTTTQSINVEDAKLFGWELESSYAMGPFTAKVGLSYLEAENDDTGEYLRNFTPVTLVTDLSYAFASIDSVLGWKVRAAADNDRVGNGDTPTDRYAVHDIYFRWAPSDGQLQNLTFDFGIENLFDAEYQKKSSGADEEGQSINAKVSYKW